MHWMPFTKILVLPPLVGLAEVLYCCISSNALCITAHKIEDLLELEAKYGPLPGFTPAIDDVLNYLRQVKKNIICIALEPQTS